jgi:hypothetical protein
VHLEDFLPVLVMTDVSAADHLAYRGGQQAVHHALVNDSEKGLVVYIHNA